MGKKMRHCSISQYTLFFLFKIFINIAFVTSFTAANEICSTPKILKATKSASESQRQPKESAFAKIIRVPKGPASVSRSHYTQDGRFWGEKTGCVRSLIDQTKEPAFRWKGKVDEYAVLAFDGKRLILFDCGLPNSRTVSKTVAPVSRILEKYYLVLSRCSGPGRVRVIQTMNVQESKQVLIEINDRDIMGVSNYILTGYLIPRAKVDDLYCPQNNLGERWTQAKEDQSKGDLNAAALHWAWIATHTKNKMTRLWAIEKFCMLQSYPGATPNPNESKMLNILQNQALKKDPELKDSTSVPPKDTLLETLVGKSIILAWPKEYTTRLPMKWRFLSELDLCMEWLKDWTGRDEVRRRKKRMISRFRVDESGTALYVSFRLHIPRQEMMIPPDHGPYSHEVSHGFINVSVIAPRGRFGEGLTEVSRTSYWEFLGLNNAANTFRRKCLTLLKEHMCQGGTVLDGQGYATAAALYFVLMDHFCRDVDGSLDWFQFNKLFKLDREVEVDKNTPEEIRWELFVDVCENAFGKRAREVLRGLGLPVSDVPTHGERSAADGRNNEQ